MFQPVPQPIIEQPFSIVKGNSFSLKVQLAKLITNVGGTKANTVDAVQQVLVSLVPKTNPKYLRSTFENGVLAIKIPSTLPVGRYGLEVNVVIDNGDSHDDVHLRHFTENFLNVVENTIDAAVPEDIDIDFEMYNLGLARPPKGSSNASGNDSQESTPKLTSIKFLDENNDEITAASVSIRDNKVIKIVGINDDGSDNPLSGATAALTYSAGADSLFTITQVGSELTIVTIAEGTGTLTVAFGNVSAELAVTVTD